MVENPQTGLLKDREVMQGKPYTDIDYCKYGMPYRKRTRLWNNLQGRWEGRPLCKRVKILGRAPPDTTKWRTDRQRKKTENGKHRTPKTNFTKYRGSL